MPLKIVRDDITKMKVDAIVNAANETLLGGGGVDGAIHAAAGPALLEECRTLGGCRTGEAKITKGYDLPARYVIHTVGPVWDGGSYGEEKLLTSAYRSSLKLAEEYKCETVAFPLISAGSYAYPRAEALRIAVDTISEFLASHDMTVYIVVYDRASYQISEKLFADVAAYVDDVYVEHHIDANTARLRERRVHGLKEKRASAVFENDMCMDAAPVCESKCDSPAPEFGSAPGVESFSLAGLVENLDESFTEMLLRKIDEKGMTDAECYHKANVDRKHFSKIRSNRNYHPKKPTALAFAIALELSPEETDDLLRKAGYALSNSNRFDVIVGYFIKKGKYNIFEINEVLFAYDEALLGA